MPSQSYVPTNEAARLVWLGNYKAKLPILGALCGLSAAEIAETLNDIACVMWMMQIWYPVIQQGALGATAFKTLMTNGSGSTPLTLPRLPEFADAPRMCLPGVFPRISNQVVRIKASPGYTEVIGRELGIIGHNDDLQYPVPDLTASLEQGNGQQLVVLQYTKHGHDGAHIESRRNGGDWEFLAININKPHRDDRPLLVPHTPEIREFKMRYWDRGQPVGDYSPVARITVGS